MKTPSRPSSIAPSPSRSWPHPRVSNTRTPSGSCSSPLLAQAAYGCPDPCRRLSPSTRLRTGSSKPRLVRACPATRRVQTCPLWTRSVGGTSSAPSPSTTASAGTRSSPPTASETQLSTCSCTRATVRLQGDRRRRTPLRHGARAGAVRLQRGPRRRRQGAARPRVRRARRRDLGDR